MTRARLGLGLLLATLVAAPALAAAPSGAATRAVSVTPAGGR